MLGRAAFVQPYVLTRSSLDLSSESSLLAVVVLSSVSSLKVALVHDWLVSHRGGEHVLEAMASLFPDAPIYTLVHLPGSVSAALESHRICTSFIQRLPGAPHRFRPYLPLFPAAIEAFDLSAYDLILSTSHCVAKGVRLRAGQKHLSYVHTPMRYIWDQLPQYLPTSGRWLSEPVARLASLPMRVWDRRSAQRPTKLLANSAFVAERIRRCWGREAGVLYPPVDVETFAAGAVAEDASVHDAERPYLVLSALVSYKRNDIAVRFASQHHKPLVVIGEGPQREALQKMAGPTVRFLGRVDHSELLGWYRRAKALLFCGIEDFGIVPLEATAAGCPVIAYGKGGVLETVKEGINGVLFDTQNVAGLTEGVRRFENLLGDGFNKNDMLKHAAAFSKQNFIDGLRNHLAELQLQNFNFSL